MNGCKNTQYDLAVKMKNADFEADTARRLDEGQTQEFCRNCCRYYWVEFKQDHILKEEGGNG